ncbi:MAG: type I 3-dehydroquinate dehydratase, partial [Pseudomonadota bacterium]
GVIGVVAESADELELASEKALQCVELRADLLLDNGLSEADLFALVKAGKQAGLGVLFTLRHPTHGGTFQGSEADRVSISLEAVSAGADLFDLEWGSEAAASVQQDAPPMILSHHDFNCMPTAAELHELTEQMERTAARAIKVVPTASRLEDALTMLKWAGQSNGNISRIGFAMGEAGACSRILTTAMGGEITYASFGAPVAPGQIDINQLIAQYRIAELNRDTLITAVCIEGDVGQRKVSELNRSYAGSNRVAVAFAPADQSVLEQCTDWMPVSEILT